MDDRVNTLNPPRHDVLGVPVSMVTMGSAMAYVRAFLARPGVDLVVASNPEKVIAARKNPELMAVLKTAAMVIPDGIGVVLASRLHGQNAVARVPGSELMPNICALAAAEGHSIFLYGARPETVAQTQALLQKQYPGINIVGAQHGYVTPEEMPALVETINASGARILFVGLGSPRQELWMAEYRHQLTGVRLCQGVGGTFDAICGRPRRAPRLFLRLHLEWLYRLLSQPARIHRQRALPVFATHVLRDLIRTRRTR